MFGKLKEKLKNWAKKVSEKTEPVEEQERHKEKLKKPAEIKEKIKEIPTPTKFEIGTQKIEPDLEEIKRISEELEYSKKEIKLPEELKEIKKEKPKEKKSFFEKIKIPKKIKVSEKDFEIYSEELKMLLLENNVAFEVAEKIIKELELDIVGKEFLKKEIESQIIDSLKDIIEKILIDPFKIEDRIKTKKPYVILFCGINGTGKTTTIAKIAKSLQDKNLSCVMAAADTFRAASIEQIKKHAEKLGLKLISHDYGSDPASVGFDAVKYAEKNRIDSVLIDTAGRMHSEKNLLKELEKIKRVCKPDLKIFVGEAITGNDSVEQIKSFDWAIGIDGIILTKADTDEKGGTALSLGYITKKPILYLGTGQTYKDLTPFDKKKFIEELGL